MNITITNSHLTAHINPHGAELISLKNDNREYIWEGNPEFWGKHSPILFPIVGTLKDNSYNHNGTAYAMTRHGFARDNKFAVKEHDSKSVVFSLVANAEIKKQFPFNFELELKYTLKDTTLYLDYTVRNTGTETMPFSLGAHPAFAMPGDFEDYSLQFEKEEPLTATLLENDLLSDDTVTLITNNGELALGYSLFSKDALIFKTLTSDFIEIKKRGEAFLKVGFEDFPHMGIWTKENAPFLCIEPWQGYSDAYNASGTLKDKDGIVLLEPQTQYNAGFYIKILG